jgi:hypothetical protein
LIDDLIADWRLMIVELNSLLRNEEERIKEREEDWMTYFFPVEPDDQGEPTKTCSKMTPAGSKAA